VVVVVVTKIAIILLILVHHPQIFAGWPLGPALDTIGIDNASARLVESPSANNTCTRLLSRREVKHYNGGDIPVRSYQGNNNNNNNNNIILLNKQRLFIS